MTSENQSPPRVASLHIYPVKSCAGIEVPSFKITPRGPQFDREWMIIDDETGIFVTQRVLPSLARIQTRLSPTHLIVAVPQSSGEVTEFKFLIENASSLQKIRNVKVWEDTCLATDEGDDIAKALGEFLGGKPVRLVRMDQNARRLIPEKYNRPGSHVSFADAFSVLLMTKESLADLNARLPSPVPMNRFRPNIVVEGARPYEEDSWTKVRIGDIRFESPKLCDRCVIVNTDQSSGRRDVEPLKTLASYRRGEKNKVYFGQNLTHLNEGFLKIGDEVSDVIRSQN
jgi:uncharacterized protein